MLDRRSFSAILALGLIRAGGASAQSADQAPLGHPALHAGIVPDAFMLGPNGWVPNNPHLPILLYKGAVEPAGTEPAARFEAVFQQNGWPPQWRNGVYDFHHYHSTAHEVLGFAAGGARLMFGGEGGHESKVRAGGVAVMPTLPSPCRASSHAGDLWVGGAAPLPVMGS